MGSGSSEKKGRGGGGGGRKGGDSTIKITTSQLTVVNMIAGKEINKFESLFSQTLDSLKTNTTLNSLPLSTIFQAINAELVKMTIHHWVKDKKIDSSSTVASVLNNTAPTPKKTPQSIDIVLDKSNSKRKGIVNVLEKNKSLKLSSDIAGLVGLRAEMSRVSL
jgi:hypothetical protein